MDTNTFYTTICFHRNGHLQFAVELLCHRGLWIIQVTDALYFLPPLLDIIGKTVFPRARADKLALGPHFVLFLLLGNQGFQFGHLLHGGCLRLRLHRHMR